MDNYQKVNRQFREMDGAFVGVYFTRNPNEQPRFTTHLIVLIHSSKTAENQTVLQKMEEVNEVFGSRMREGNPEDGPLENFKRF